MVRRIVGVVARFFVIALIMFSVDYYSNEGVYYVSCEYQKNLISTFIFYENSLFIKNIISFSYFNDITEKFKIENVDVLTGSHAINNVRQLFRIIISSLHVCVVSVVVSFVNIFKSIFSYNMQLVTTDMQIIIGVIMYIIRLPIIMVYVCVIMIFQSISGMYLLLWLVMSIVFLFGILFSMAYVIDGLKKTIYLFGYYIKREKL